MMVRSLWQTLPLLLALTLGAEAASAQSAPHGGPVFAGFGNWVPVESDIVIPKGTVLRHVYDVTAAAPGRRNPGFETAARFINSHVGHGMAERDVAVAVVVHGPAIAELSKPEAYAARQNGAANASEAMVKAMLAKGVRFIVCGQAAAAMGVAKADLLPGVELSISASSAHAVLQAQGYTLNPF